MPENCPGGPGNRNQGQQPEQPPSRSGGSAEWYNRFVEEQRRTYVSELPIRPLVLPPFHKPPLGSRAEGAGPPPPWSPRQHARRKAPGRALAALIVLGILLLALAGGCVSLFSTFSGPLSQIVG